MANAGIDENSRQTLTALSNADDGTIVDLWADPVTHRLLVDLAVGAGTVTMVSVVSANGFYGTVANDTTTPAITLNTPITGIIKGTGTAMTAAVAGVDYGLGTVTLVSIVSANGFSGTVATDSTTPAVTLRTPISGILKGNGTAMSAAQAGVDYGTVTLVSVVSANGVSGSVATDTTTPAITVDLGNISPTSIIDSNGNRLIDLTTTASAVNGINITNAATGTTGPLISASGETNVDLRLAGTGTGKVHKTTGSYGDVTSYSPSGGATATLTFNTSNIHTVNMPAGNATIAFSNASAGQCVLINIVQDSGGSRTVTWPVFIRWAGGSAPTLTTAGNKIDTIGIAVGSGGTPYLGYVVGSNL